MSSTFDTVAKIISETCDIPHETIKPESHAINDLGIDSLDFLDIAFAIDKAFGIKMPLEDHLGDLRHSARDNQAGKSCHQRSWHRQPRFSRYCLCDRQSIRNQNAARRSSRRLATFRTRQSSRKVMPSTILASTASIFSILPLRSTKHSESKCRSKIISETCDIPHETIKPESHAINDLGIDSLDFLDIAFAIDKAFGIKMPLEQ